jgi:hypothetical protein
MFLTINVPLILKVRDIIFFPPGKTYNGAFRGVCRGGWDFLTPKLCVQHEKMAYELRSQN